jgi:hypothetical protein
MVHPMPAWPAPSCTNQGKRLVNDGRRPRLGRNARQYPWASAVYSRRCGQRWLDGERGGRPPSDHRRKAPDCGRVSRQAYGGRSTCEGCRSIDVRRWHRDPCHWTGKRGVDLLVELADDIGGRVHGHDETAPVARLVTGHEIGHSWDAASHRRSTSSQWASAFPLLRPPCRGFRCTAWCIVVSGAPPDLRAPRKIATSANWCGPA